jgi:hypothetical protein
MYAKFFLRTCLWFISYMPLLLDDFVMKHINEPVHCSNVQFKVLKELLIRTLVNYYKLLREL